MLVTLDLSNQWFRWLVQNYDFPLHSWVSDDVEILRVRDTAYRSTSLAFARARFGHFAVGPNTVVHVFGIKYLHVANEWGNNQTTSRVVVDCRYLLLGPIESERPQNFKVNLWIKFEHNYLTRVRKVRLSSQAKHKYFAWLIIFALGLSLNVDATTHFCDHGVHT